MLNVNRVAIFFLVHHTKTEKLLNDHTLHKPNGNILRLFKIVNIMVDPKKNNWKNGRRRRRRRGTRGC
jgi:hypothetical protein